MTRHPTRPGDAAGGGDTAAASGAVELSSAVRTEPRIDFLRLFEALPGIHVVVTADPDHVMVAASDERCRATMTRREDVIGRRLFDVFPDNPADGASGGTGNLRASLARVAATGAAHRMALQRYDLRRPDGTFEERWWQPLNTPVPGPDDRAAHILHTVEDVTASVLERRDAAAALRAERDHRHAIFEGMDEGFLLLDPSFHVAEINAEGLRIDGRPREAIVGRHLLEVWPEAERLPAWPAYRRAMAERVPVAVEYRHASAAHDIWLDVRAYPVAKGEGLAVFYRDVTGRKRAEAVLHEGMARFRLMADAVPQIVWITDAEGRAEFFNRQWTDYTGVPYEPTTAAKVAASFVHPDDAATTMERFEGARRVGGTFSVEHRIRSKTGDYRWFLVRAEPYRDPATGGIVRWFGASVDIHDRKQAEAALRESEARFRHMADSAPALIWMSDARGQVVFANMHYEHVFGRPAAAMLGQGWERDVLAEDLPGYREAFRDAFRARRAFRAEVRVRNRDGQVRWLRVEAVPRLDDQGTFLGYTGCNVDITEAKLAAEELEARVAERTAALSQAVDALHAEALERAQAEEALRQSQKMEAVGQLTGGIAHDFNNMLQAIGGSLEMVQRRVAQGRAAEADRHAGDARRTMERAAALTHRLLAFARQQALQPKLVEPDELVGGMVELIRRTVGPGVAVEPRLRDGAWSVLCDPNQLENVLLNLAINARDAMPGGGRLTVATADVRLLDADVAGQDRAEPGDYVEIAVADTGTGMDAATRARAFEPFFTTKPIGQGTGLGLSQLYGFVRQSGGVVRLESAPGRGTTVRLYLPRYADTDADGQEAEGTEPDRADVPQAGAVGTVLLVEDEAGVRALAAEALGELGCHVLEAEDGPAALRLLRLGARVDVLVTDVGLPGGMNGRQVADAARQRRPGLPVLFITGYAGGVLDGQLAPGMEVIGKPFTLDALAAKVQAILQAAPAT